MDLTTIAPGDVVADTFFVVSGLVEPNRFPRIEVAEVLDVEEYAVNVRTTNGKFTGILHQRPEDYIVWRDGEVVHV